MADQFLLEENTVLTALEAMRTGRALGDHPLRYFRSVRVHLEAPRPLTSDAAIEYAIDTTSGTQPIRVLNASWTFSQSFHALRDAIEARARRDGLETVTVESVRAVAAQQGAGRAAA